MEVDAASWRITRRLPAGPGVYNLAVTKAENMFKNKVGTVEELRTYYAQPGKVSLQKQRPTLDSEEKTFY